MFARAPAILGAVAVFGLYEAALMALLPIWGVRSGLTERLAAATLSAVYFGSIVLQVLIGWLSDRISRLAALRLCGAVGLVGAIAAGEHARLAACAVLPAVRVGRGGVGDLSGGTQHGGRPVPRRRSGERQCRDDHRLWPGRAGGPAGGRGRRWMSSTRKACCGCSSLLFAGIADWEQLAV